MDTAEPRLSDVTAALDRLYDPGWAADWDAVGLVCGEPHRPVRRVLFAVDPVDAVVAEALDWGADLVVTHHPLLLRGVTSVAATTPKGMTVHRLIAAGVALFTAHTNADVAHPGVSDALAAAVGLTGPLRPLQPDPGDPAGERGLGRIGELARPLPLREFAARAAAALPATPAGIRVGGDLDRTVRLAAVSGGAGDSLLGTARAAGVDVFLTSDLRHHPASEFLEHHDVALIDTPHWVSEWPWLADAARRLRSALADRGADVQCRVSEVVTDAWGQQVPSAAPGGTPRGADGAHPPTPPKEAS